jgi:hypothetical protein
LRSLFKDYLPDMASLAVALALAGLAAVLAAALSGCGGGVGTEGTGSYASGTISGYGSIIVNGIHFDETAATVQDDDGTGVARNALALGMVVQVSGGPISSNGTVSSAQANAIQTVRALVGPASAINVASSQLLVLGQKVLVSAATVFDDRISGGLAGVTNGQLLEVYGYFDNTANAYNATRIGKAASGSGYVVSGLASNVDAAAKTCTIGGQTYSYASLGTTSGLVDGAPVRLKLQSAPDASGRWVVTGQRSDNNTPQDKDGAEIDGVVTKVVSATRFVASGVTVDTSGASISGAVVLGAQIEASGKLQAGVLVASKVQATSPSTKTFEINGTVSGLDTANHRFVVRGTTVSYGRPDLQFKGGTAATLVGYTGQVKVEGVLSADRTQLDATKIEFGG